MAGKKAATLWMVNVLSSILFIILAVTGLVNWLILPHGGRGAAGFLVATRHFLMEIHEWTAVLFIAAICVHVALHWAYVRTNLKKSLQTQRS
ncbi:MAG: DUF4405 domain-containing protein [Pseudomonadota bacterium]